jgi:hypothetical protein
LGLDLGLFRQKVTDLFEMCRVDLLQLFAVLNLTSIPSVLGCNHFEHLLPLHIFCLSGGRESPVLALLQKHVGRLSGQPTDKERE